MSTLVNSNYDAIKRRIQYILYIFSYLESQMLSVIPFSEGIFLSADLNGFSSLPYFFHLLYTHWSIPTRVAFQHMLAVIAFLSFVNLESNIEFPSFINWILRARWFSPGPSVPARDRESTDIPCHTSVHLCSPPPLPYFIVFVFIYAIIERKPSLTAYGWSAFVQTLWNFPARRIQITPVRLCTTVHTRLHFSFLFSNPFLSSFYFEREEDGPTTHYSTLEKSERSFNWIVTERAGRVGCAGCRSLLSRRRRSPLTRAGGPPPPPPLGDQVEGGSFGFFRSILLFNRPKD